MNENIFNEYLKTNEQPNKEFNGKAELVEQVITAADKAGMFYTGNNSFSEKADMWQYARNDLSTKSKEELEALLVQYQNSEADTWHR